MPIFASAQRNGRTMTPNDFIGIWELRKIADNQLKYTNRSFDKETIQYTTDSVFVVLKDSTFVGTWKLVKGQAVIDIPSTTRFNYKWISGGLDSKFFTTDNLGYYKYFVRTSRLAQ